MRDDLLGFLDALELPRVDLVGHSMGGVVSYLFAMAHPDRVGRVVLEETPPPFPRPDVVVPERPADAETLPYDWKAVAAIRAQVRTPPATWLASLPDIEAPTLVIAGGPDSQVPQDRIADMAAAMPPATLITIDAGHLVHIMRPDDFVAAVADHLDG